MTTGPMFNDARGAASSLQMAPPFAFSDVTMTVFPLLANLSRLNEFIKSYLNQADDVVQFQPFMPFVYLIILDYGKMSARAAKTGWVSQREVAFGIPLQWMVPTPDGLKFHDWAFTTPFIFVDNELSLSTGREVYGWPKLLARLDPDTTQWINDPHGARTVFEIRSQAAGDRPGDVEKLPFLRVTQRPVSGLTDLPPRLNSVTRAISDWPMAMMGMARTGRDLYRAFADLAADRLRDANDAAPRSDAAGMREMFRNVDPKRMLDPKAWRSGVAQGLSAAFPQLYSNTINLKQFRDAADPDDTCYQAITAAKMPIERIGGGGLLGMNNMLVGQLNGGFNIHIANTTAVPIVSSLGLEPSDTHRANGGHTATLSPISPFWIKLDMLYGKGTTLAWRRRQGDWRTVDGTPGVAARPKPAPVPTAAPSAASGQTNKLIASPAFIARPSLRPAAQIAENARRLTRKIQLIEPSNPFNTTRGASEAIGGTFRMPDAQMRVLPLRADPEVLGKFIDHYIQVPGHMKVKLWGEHVYMLISNFKHMTADLNPGASTASREIKFSVPVKCYDVSEGGDPVDETQIPKWIDTEAKKEAWLDGANKLVGTALVTPFSYVDDMPLAIAESEVFGIPTLRSDIESPPHGWTDTKESYDIVAEAKAIVVPSLGTNSEGTVHSLLQVRARPVLPEWDTAGWRNLASTWGQQLVADIDKKLQERGVHREPNTNPSANHASFPFEASRGLLLKVLGGERGINLLSLKQFRDADAPESACYQGVVAKSLRVKSLKNVQEIDEDLSVAIARFPTQPIGKILGLIPKRTVVTKDTLVDEFEPIRPFEVMADLEYEGGETLFERAEDVDWDRVHQPEGLLGWQRVTPEEVVALKETSPPFKFTFMCHKEGETHLETLPPTEVTDETLAILDHKRQQHDILDLKVLSRASTVRLSCTADVLNALDNGEVEDVDVYIRSLKNDPSRENELAFKTYEVAGALELISPATILDVVLNRGWGREQSPILSPVDRCDFRLRCGTFGPELGETLFPLTESQWGFWPASDDYMEQSLRQQSARMLLLRFEFWGLMDAASDAKKPSEKKAGEELLELAREIMPPWFKPVDEYPKPNLLESCITFDVEHIGKIGELAEAFELFKERSANHPNSEQLRLFHKHWDRALQQMSEDTDDSEWTREDELLDRLQERLTKIGVR